MNTIASVAVVVEPSPVIDVKSVGVAGPPGTPGAPGPAGPAGPQGPAGTAGPHQATHAVGGSDPVTGPLALSPYVSVGVNPSQSGAVRLPNDQAIKSRNAANTADTSLVTRDPSNNLIIGDYQTHATYLDGSSINLRANTAVDGILAATNGITTPAQIALGVNPSQSGAVRLANNSPITARNAANTADVALMQVDASNKVFVGQTTAATQVNGSDIVINTVAAAYTVDANGIYPNNDNARRIGYPTLRFSDANLYAISLKEKTAPAVPGANEANLWLEDNGAGKSRLMIQFATGAPIAIATQV